MEKTEGLIIRQADFSESSRVITFFTADYGKIAVLAKGAKRLKSPFEAALDLLTRCRVVFLQKSADRLHILTEAQLISRFRAPQRDVFRHYAGLYVAELLDGFSEPNDPAPDWYAAAMTVLEHLQQPGDAKLSVLRFEMLTLATLGLLPEFDHCQCGQPVEPDHAQWSVWIQQGVLLCTQCRRPERSARPLTGEVLTLLRAVLASDPDEPLDLTVPANFWPVVRPLTTALLAHTLGRRPKMLSYLQF